MVALPFLRRDVPVLRGERVYVRTPLPDDYHEWAAVRGRSRSFLEPWEPSWSADELDRYAWRQRIRRYREEVDHGTGIAFLIFQAHDGQLSGGISMGNIRRGVAQSAQIGYWMGAEYAGHGMMFEALNLVVAFAFGSLGLHRLEAACIPDNARSIGLLEKARFRREGLLQSYLKINGVWRDHLLYALLDQDYRTLQRRG